MPLETATFISDLDPANPVGSSDLVSSLDDHARLIKATLLATFPNITGAVTPTPTELNLLDGITGFTGTGTTLVKPESPTFTGTVTADTVAASTVAAITLTGAGSGITALNATNLDSGTVADARLSSNVPLKNGTNAFTGTNTFGGVNVTDFARISATNTSAFDTISTERVLWQHQNTGASTIAQFAETSYSNFSRRGWKLTGGEGGTANGAFVEVGNLFVSIGGSSVSGEVLRVTNAGLASYGGIEVGFRDAVRVTAAIERGKVRAVSAGFTLDTGQGAGSTFGIYNDSAAAITITQGAGLTLRLHGTTTTGNRTILARGMAVVWANSTTEYVMMGDVS